MAEHSILNTSAGGPEDGARRPGEGVRSTFVSTFEEAVVSHAIWRANFVDLVRNGGGGLDVEVVGRENVCPLGRWLTGEGQEAVGNPVAHRMLCNVHAEFHTEAARVLSLAQSGRIKEALHVMESDQPYGTWSTTLVAALSQYANSFGDAAAG